MLKIKRFNNSIDYFECRFINLDVTGINDGFETGEDWIMTRIARINDADSPKIESGSDLGSWERDCRDI